MRWTTYQPGDVSEEARRALTQARIEGWWREFVRRADDIDQLFRRKQEWDLAAWVNHHLRGIDPHLMWEFGPGVKGGHRLVITPENRHDLRPLTEEILSQAPSIEGWEFYPYRLREGLQEAKAMVEARTGEPLAAVGYRCMPGAFNLVDVACEFPKRFLKTNSQLAFNQSFVLLETLLGEEILDHWLGGINAEPKSRKGRPLDDLSDSFDRTKQEILRALPGQPLHQIDREFNWTLFEMKPNVADDYPGQSDMLVGKAMFPDLWQNVRNDYSFCSQRYSRCGEIFCYVKIDGSEGLDEEYFRDKGDIEDALDGDLRASGVGRFIGGGTGYRYSYIDLALTDLQEASGIIKQVLQGGNIDRRTWIQFCDTDLSSEWIGIWPDTPAPPQVDMGDD